LTLSGHYAARLFGVFYSFAKDVSFCPACLQEFLESRATDFSSKVWATCTIDYPWSRIGRASCHSECCVALRCGVCEWALRAHELPMIFIPPPLVLGLETAVLFFPPAPLLYRIKLFKPPFPPPLLSRLPPPTPVSSPRHYTTILPPPPPLPSLRSTIYSAFRPQSPFRIPNLISLFPPSVNSYLPAYLLLLILSPSPPLLPPPPPDPRPTLAPHLPPPEFAYAPHIHYSHSPFLSPPQLRTTSPLSLASFYIPPTGAFSPTSSYQSFSRLVPCPSLTVLILSTLRLVLPLSYQI